MWHKSVDERQLQRAPERRGAGDGKLIVLRGDCQAADFDIKGAAIALKIVAGSGRRCTSRNCQNTGGVARRDGAAVVVESIDDKRAAAADDSYVQFE
ncbi:MAG: hypothetical protein AB7N71_13325 [Phycisphaerae bacterium]